MWTVQVEEDPETGQLLLPFPADLLSQMGWSEGTELFWEDKGNNSFSLTEVKKSSPPEESDTDVGC
jgi:hypothetical protein